MHSGSDSGSAQGKDKSFKAKSEIVKSHWKTVQLSLSWFMNNGFEGLFESQRSVAPGNRSSTSIKEGFGQRWLDSVPAVIVPQHCLLAAPSPTWCRAPCGGPWRDPRSRGPWWGRVAARRRRARARIPPLPPCCQNSAPAHQKHKRN